MRILTTMAQINELSDTLRESITQVHKNRSVKVVMVTQPEYKDIVHDGVFQNKIAHKDVGICLSKFKGDDCQEKFIKLLQTIDDAFIRTLCSRDLPMEITKEEKKQAKKDKICWFCGDEIICKGRCFVRSRITGETCSKWNGLGGKILHHDHITGKYIGVAHNLCNLHDKNSEIRIPVLAHYLFGYDNNPMLQTFAEMYLKLKNVVPEENEVDWSPNAVIEMDKEREEDPIYSADTEEKEEEDEYIEDEGKFEHPEYRKWKKQVFGGFPRIQHTAKSEQKFVNMKWGNYDFFDPMKYFNTQFWQISSIH